MPKLIQYIFLILTILLPIQNALINFVVNKLGLPEWLSFWKEFLTAVLMLYFLVELAKALHQKKYKLRWHYWQNKWSLAAITLATLVSFVSSFGYNNIAINNFIVGFRFELWWLWFFAITVTWYLTVSSKTSQTDLLKTLKTGVNIGFALVALITLASLLFGQQTISSIWLSQEAQVGKYITSAPSCHVIDYQIDGCRLAGPFSTPNHLTGYLLLILPIFLVNVLLAIYSKKLFQNIVNYFDFGVLLLIVLFIILSFSRFAWLGLATFLAFLVIIFGIKLLPRKPQFINLIKAFFVLALLFPLFIATVAVNIPEDILKNSPLPGGLTKPSSTALHARHTLASLDILKTNPNRLILGFGLPSSGPGARDPFLSEYDNKMLVENGYIAYQYGLVAPDLATPENWFLQILLNGGVVYFLLCVAILLIPIYSLIKAILDFNFNNPLANKWLFYGLGFFGVILGNLLLHIWENQTITLYWVIIWLYAVSLSNSQGQS